VPAPALTRTIFSAYAPSPLNDASVPPFPGHEADDEDDTPREGLELEYERSQYDWAPIPPGEPTDDVPVRFVDGSITSKTVGSLLVDYRRRPIIAAAVSAAALEIDGRETKRGAGTRTRKVLCVYSDGVERNAISDAFHALRGIGVELLERPLGAVLGDFDTMRRATRGLAMEAMEEAERAVMLADFMKPTLMDGLLERRLATAPTHNVPIIGLVKRQMTAYLPAGLQEMTYALKAGERTPAFILRTVQHVDLVNTYVRLSAEAGTSPSYGIVRVTAPLAYVEQHHADDMPAYLSGLAAYLYRLRHRDLAYSRAGISVEPIVRVEDHLHAILPDLDALIPRLHRMFARPTNEA
jgi:hypothetical protein